MCHPSTSPGTPRRSVQRTPPIEASRTYERCAWIIEACPRQAGAGGESFARQRAGEFAQGGHADIAKPVRSRSTSPTPSSRDGGDGEALRQFRPALSRASRGTRWHQASPRIRLATPWPCQPSSRRSSGSANDYRDGSIGYSPWPWALAVQSPTCCSMDRNGGFGSRWGCSRSCCSSWSAALSPPKAISHREGRGTAACRTDRGGPLSRLLRRSKAGLRPLKGVRHDPQSRLHARHAVAASCLWSQPGSNR